MEERRTLTLWLRNPSPNSLPLAARSRYNLFQPRTRSQKQSFAGGILPLAEQSCYIQEHQSRILTTSTGKPSPAGEELSLWGNLP